MIYIIALLLLSAVAKGFCDKISFQPFNAWFKSDWWLATGNHSWDKRTWLTKNIFSFVSDGWHFFDAVRVMSLCLIVCYALQIPAYLSIVAYIIHGLVFELTYRVK